MPEPVGDIAREAVAIGETATARRPERTDYGTQVAASIATARDAEGDLEALRIAAGRRLNTDMIRANVNISFGSKDADGNMVRPAGSPEEARFTRANNILDQVDQFFDDSRSFDQMIRTAEGRAVRDNVADFLMTHPALIDYFDGFANPAQARAAARETAVMYLGTPQSREKIREAVTSASLNNESVDDELSTHLASQRNLDQRRRDLRRRRNTLETRGKTAGEIDQARARRREYDRYSDPAAGTAGVEFTHLETARTDIADLDSQIGSETRAINRWNSDVQHLRGELRQVQQTRSRPAAVVVRDEAAIQADIATLQTDIRDAETRIQAHETAKAGHESTIREIESEKARLDEQISNQEGDLNSIIDELNTVEESLREVNISITDLQQKKARLEEEAVSQLEGVFRKGVEDVVVDRLEAAREAAQAALDEAAANEEDDVERRYRETRAERHTRENGSFNGQNINNDYELLMTSGSEIGIAPGPPPTFEHEAAAVAALPAEQRLFLNGPQKALANMMIQSGELSHEQIMSRVRDKEWLDTESSDYAKQILDQKYMASRGIWRRLRTRVGRFSKNEITRIQNSDWAINWIQGAIDKDAAKRAEIDAAIGGSMFSEGRLGLESFRKMSPAKLMLLIAILAGAGAVTGGLALGAAGAASGLGVAGVAAGGVAGVGIGGVGGGVTGAGVGIATRE